MGVVQATVVDGVSLGDNVQRQVVKGVVAVTFAAKAPDITFTARAPDITFTGK